jgi:Na+/H+ antiporter NhaC
MRSRRVLWLAVLITALGAPELRAQEVEVDMPSALLKGIGFTVRVSTPVSLDTLPVVLRTADGRVLAESVLPPVGEVAFRDIVVEDRAALPLILTVGGHREELAAPFLPAWFSLLPPLMAIALALIFHEVVSSLFLGSWLGCVFLAGYNPFAAFFMTIDRYIMPALADTDHASIVVFSLLLGGMVGVMTRMGGTQAIVEAVTPLATSRRRAQLATWLAGLAIFFDDYANTLLVGNTMRPLTDKRLVSREKLAYIVDSTAAPVSAIVFVSTWVGYEISLIDDGMRLAVEQGVATGAAAEQLSATSAFGVFLMSIPYLFYPILAIFAVALFILSKRDFGPMLAAERRTVSGGGVHRPGAQLAADMEGELGTPPEGAPRRWWNGVVPVAVVVATVLGALLWTGTRGLGDADVTSFQDTARYVLDNTDAFAALLWGALLGCTVAVAMATSQRILTLSQSVLAAVGGMRAMMVAMIILVLAWSLGEVTSSLSTASFCHRHVVGHDGDPHSPGRSPLGGHGWRPGGRRGDGCLPGWDRVGAGGFPLWRSLLADLRHDGAELDGLELRPRGPRAYAAALRAAGGGHLGRRERGRGCRVRLVDVGSRGDDRGGRCGDLWIRQGGWEAGGGSLGSSRASLARGPTFANWHSP